MKVGFVGLGKLGLPCALAIEAYGGHEIFGVESDERVRENIERRFLPYREVGAQALLDETKLQLCDADALVQVCDLIFVAVQTPHEPEFEGITPLPEGRADFDYRYLREAVANVAEAAGRQQRTVVLVVISTVLPGTMNREIAPLLNPYVKLCYNPFFIAMGTTIQDFMNPEFILMGSDHPDALDLLRSFYGTLHQAQCFETSIESAELIKVAYNTFIGMKIIFANTLMEICHGTGANVDDVTSALGLATNRLISSKYLRAGMGDGGGCHPRDNIAMSFLARKLGLSFDFFESLMQARERQTDWLASLAIEASRERGLPIVILGAAFKPETNLTTGSPATLLRNLLQERGIEATIYDPYVHVGAPPIDQPAIFFVATKHAVFAERLFPKGSVVLDPWGYVPDREGVEVRRIGRSPETAGNKVKVQA